MGTQITRKGLVFLGVLLTAAALAHAGPPSIFVGAGSKLLRIHDGSMDLFDLDPNVLLGGMSFDAQGRLWATGPDSDGDGNRSICQIADPFGTPHLVEVADIVPYTAISGLAPFGDDLYLIVHDGAPPYRLVIADIQAGTCTPVGDTGATGIYCNGITVDPDGMVMYGVGYYGHLYTLDWQLESHPNPTATLVGDMGISMEGRGIDFDYFSTEEELYALCVDIDTQEYEVYKVDPNTAQATLAYDLTSVLGSTGARKGFSIAVIPEPTALALFAAGAVALIRRKR